jgi:uncharacterized protein (DUF1697 family)
MDDVRIALPRAVNLGPHKKVAMGDLRTMVSDLGLDDVRTILNSGNLFFRSKRSPASLERTLEDESARVLGLDTEYYVRTGAEWTKIVKGNPFAAFARRDPSHLMVHFCKKAAGRSLTPTGRHREDVKAKGREIYVTYPDSIGTSKLNLGVVSTARNWNTILKLEDLASGL